MNESTNCRQILTTVVRIINTVVFKQLLFFRNKLLSPFYLKAILVSQAIVL